MLFDELRITQLDTGYIAAAIGIMTLLILTLPGIMGVFVQKGRFRRSIVERHSQKLRRESMRRGRSSPSAEQPRQFAMVFSALRAFVPDRMAKERQKLLRSAGYAGDLAFPCYCIVKFVSITVFVVGTALVFWLADTSGGIVTVFQASAAVGLLGFFATDIFLRLRRSKRLKRMLGGLPDGLDLLVICAEAGLSLDSALRRVADEFVTMVPELAEELFLTSVELNFLPDRRQALVNFSQRVDVPAIRGVTSTLIQTEKYGTPLSNALRTLSSEFRETRLLTAEEKAARLPAILTVPMICFILPALFIVLAAPAFIKVAEKFG